MAALAMSATKDDLVKRLKLNPETYSLMAKETDKVYRWLTTDEKHLKKNCKRNPPYDWSDITEKSKHEAMEILARSGDARTTQYWQQGDDSGSDGCVNWIARWFLYHKFRYRDGRNKGKDAGSSKQSAGSCSPQEAFAVMEQPNEIKGYDYYNSGISGTSAPARYLAQAELNATTTQFISYNPTPHTADRVSHDKDGPKGFYDPVKGWIDKQAPN